MMRKASDFRGGQTGMGQFPIAARLHQAIFQEMRTQARHALSGRKQLQFIYGNLRKAIRDQAVQEFAPR
jgi:hypothetical protein